MISYIYLKNFKAFQTAEIYPSALNIFSGLNGMGKSTFLQALLLLRQSFLQNTLLDKGLLLNGDYVNLGKGKDVFSLYATDDVLKFEIEWEKAEISLLSEFFYREEKEEEADLLPNVKKSNYLDLIFEQALFSNEFQYLNAERVSPKDFFPSSAYAVEQLHSLGNHGQFTTHFIAKNQNKNISLAGLKHNQEDSLNFLDQLDAWLTEIVPGIKLSTQLYQEFELARLSYQFEAGDNLQTEFMRPTNVGFGITYVLPIIAAVLFAEKDDLLIIENPESHLHPRGQAVLGRLFALAASQGVQLFIETHSDHVLNGVRVAVKQRLIKPEQVGIFFFERESDKHITHILQPQIDKNGRLDQQPNGFFDEWGKQLDELLK